MNRKRELFIGVTSWNSSLFLPVCLKAIRDNTHGVDLRLVVLDNVSSDQSIDIARQFGAEVVVEKCLQADALNRLLSMSDARYTLLVHADVVLLDPRWFDLCREKITDQTALVSPEDIGCGPYSRPFGAGKPESSFMFFDTAKFRQTTFVQWRRWHRIPYPKRVVDFYGEHITHRLPQRLAAKGLLWRPMLVHTSDQVENPIYIPGFNPTVWNEELAYLRYGLGNFYSLDRIITHYHNWYERVDMKVQPDSKHTTGSNGTGFPVAYLKAYTSAFLNDNGQGTLVLPSAEPSSRLPKAL